MLFYLPVSSIGPGVSSALGCAVRSAETPALPGTSLEELVDAQPLMLN